MDVGHWDESESGHRSIRDIDKNLSNVDVVLYRQHYDICANQSLIIIIRTKLLATIANWINVVIYQQPQG